MANRLHLEEHSIAPAAASAMEGFRAEVVREVQEAFRIALPPDPIGWLPTRFGWSPAWVHFAAHKESAVGSRLAAAHTNSSSAEPSAMLHALTAAEVLPCK
jgi:hypothetical protein